MYVFCNNNNKIRFKREQGNTRGVQGGRNMGGDDENIAVIYEILKNNKNFKNSSENYKQTKYQVKNKA